MGKIKESRGGRPRERDLSPLGQRIDRLMARRGLTVNELAERAGVSRHGVYNIMFGRVSSPRLETLRQLAETLGTDREKLVAGLL